MLNRLLTQAIASMNVIWCDFDVNFSKSGFLLLSRELLLRTGGSGLDIVVMHPKLRVDEWRVSPRLDMRLRHEIDSTKVWFKVVYYLDLRSV